MKKIMLSLSFVTALAALLLSLVSLDKARQKQPSSPKSLNANPKIQVAILLDVSNSMDGLIGQAKSQLWNMVSSLGRVKCQGDLSPQIEIALYEYGRPDNNVNTGYVKQINSFISDLDSLSENLFNLTTNGGDEFCGHVIKSSIDELRWDTVANNYKVIFIAGNEDFLQGDVNYLTACNSAKQKGIIVNTIYCGNRKQGINEHWNLNAECGNGSFTNINQNYQEEYIASPYDSSLVTYNNRLNNTYIAYNASGYLSKTKQNKMDQQNAAFSREAEFKRIKTKGNSKVYNNAGWDLVDAKDKDGDGALDKVDRSVLPDSLKNKSKEELKKIIEQKAMERKIVQDSIAVLNAKRETFLAAARLKKNSGSAEQTLETEIEKIIREQVSRFRMTMQ